MKKERKPIPLSNVEWTTCWMAIRYSMNGQTISTATLPQDLIKAYWGRWSDGEKKTIAIDLERNQEMWENAFGHPEIDRPQWIKFWKCCDVANHYKIKLIDGKEAIVFNANGRIYPLEEYVKSPYHEIYCPEEHILKEDV